MPLRTTAVHIAAIIGIGIVCLPVILMLAPDMNESHSEARIFVAYTEVLYFRDTLTKEKVHESEERLPDLDPWGQSYRIIPLDGGRVRVLSSGPDMSFSPPGSDSDDIFSDMPTSPLEAIYAQKRLQLLLAVAASLGLWVALAVVYLRWTRHSPV